MAGVAKLIPGLSHTAQRPIPGLAKARWETLPGSAKMTVCVQDELKYTAAYACSIFKYAVHGPTASWYCLAITRLICAI